MATFTTLWMDFLKFNGNVVHITNFLPGTVIEEYERATDRKFARQSIVGWSSFENCEIEWDSATFSDLIGIKQFPQETRLFLVTDEGYRDQIVFQFMAKDFPIFADWYSDYYKMDFFQSADYLLFEQGFTTINIIHHNGVSFRTTSLEK